MKLAEDIFSLYIYQASVSIAPAQAGEESPDNVEHRTTETVGWAYLLRQKVSQKQYRLKR